MGETTIAWTTEFLNGSVLRIAFTGRGGIGAAGNPDGSRMNAAVQDLVKEKKPTRLLIDLSGFEYRFGDWIGALALIAYKQMGAGRVCLIAVGETASALRSLWKVANHLERFAPIVADVDAALEYLTHPATPG
jgi:hypothetical protein